MPSLEMLKKLLDEFAEKEAHTREEINVITEQIGELEKRVLASKEKLSTVAGDREKIKMMQSRYSGGSTLVSGDGPNNPLSSPAQAEPRAKTRPGRAEKHAATAELTPAIPNPRASSTRLPASKAPEMPAETSSPFFNAPEPSPAQPVTNPFATVQYQPPQPAEVVSEVQHIPEPAPSNDPNTFPYPEPAPTPTTPPFSGVNESNYMGAAEAPAAQTVDNSNNPFFRPVTSARNTPPVAPPEPQPVPVQEIPQPVQPQIDYQQQQIQPQVQQPVAATADESGPQIQDLEEEESDDTVKSINDALRGLFR